MISVHGDQLVPKVILTTSVLFYLIGNLKTADKAASLIERLPWVQLGAEGIDRRIEPHSGNRRKTN